MSTIRCDVCLHPLPGDPLQSGVRRHREHCATAYMQSPTFYNARAVGLDLEADRRAAVAERASPQAAPPAAPAPPPPQNGLPLREAGDPSGEAADWVDSVWVDPIWIIDDSPGRHEEFVQHLFAKKIPWVISCDPGLISILAPNCSAIVLDHDMPYRDGRAWVRDLIVHYRRRPVVIVSTTGSPGVRETMVAELEAANWPVLLCPADHYGCELEWRAWIEAQVSDAR